MKGSYKMKSNLTMEILKEELKRIRKDLEIIAKNDEREFPKNYCINASMYVFKELQLIYGIDAPPSCYNFHDINGEVSEHWINEFLTEQRIFVDMTADQFKVFKDMGKYGLIDADLFEKYYKKLGNPTFSSKDINFIYNNMKSLLKHEQI